MMNKASVDPKPGEDEAYLVVPDEHRKTIVAPDTVWAKIGDDGQLESIRWDIINMYAAQYDALGKMGKDKSQTHVMCKLMVLVREQALKEVAHE
jgi:hypothetical protein